MLLDFDDCGWGHVLYDLAVTISEIGYLPHGPELLAAYLAGYRQVRDLSATHEAMFNAFLSSRASPKTKS